MAEQWCQNCSGYGYFMVYAGVKYYGPNVTITSSSISLESPPKLVRCPEAACNYKADKLMSFLVVSPHE